MKCIDNVLVIKIKLVALICLINIIEIKYTL